LPDDSDLAVPATMTPRWAASGEVEKICRSLKDSPPFERRLSMRRLTKCFGHESCNVNDGGSALTGEHSEKRGSMTDRKRRRSLTQVAMATVISGSMVGAFLAVGGLGSGMGGQIALAANSTTQCKPGNGFGDKNHCHFGPPGQTMTTTGSTTTGSTTTGNTTTGSTTTGTTTTGTTTTGTTTTGTTTTGTTVTDTDNDNDNDNGSTTTGSTTTGTTTTGTTVTDTDNDNDNGSTTTGTTTTGSTTTGTTTTVTTTTASTTSTESTQCKPGNGFGDKNHCHSGPPGHKKHGKH